MTLTEVTLVMHYLQSDVYGRLLSVYGGNKLSGECCSFVRQDSGLMNFLQLAVGVWDS